MPGKPEHDFELTELDRDLLSASCGVQTKWHVVTGAPCCGKTTLLEQLAGKGFRTVPEVARGYFETEIAKGRTIDGIRADDAALERYLFNLQLQLERRLRTDDTLFLDRGLPDCLAFCRIFGLNPNEFLVDCLHHRYASVFVLDRLPFQRDATLGPEDDATASYLDEWHARDYSALGYSVVRVPVLSPEGRLAFVLERLAEQGRL
jgi:predicted ATPase